MPSTRTCSDMAGQVLLCLTVLLACCAGAPSVDRSSESGHSCYHCTDASNNTECQHLTRCLHSQNRCLTQIWFSDSGIVIGKRCAPMQKCYVYEENNEDACSNPDEEFEGYCSFCCEGPGCNQGLPPYGTVSEDEADDVDDGDSKSHGSKSGGHGSKSGGHGSKSGGHGSKSGGHGSKSGGPGSKSGGHGSKSKGPGSKSGGHGSKSGGHGSKSGGPGSKSGGHGSKSGGHGSKSGGHGSKSGGHGSKSGGHGSHSGGPGGKSGGPGGPGGPGGKSGGPGGPGGKSGGPGGPGGPGGKSGGPGGPGGKSGGPGGKSHGPGGKSGGPGGKSGGPGGPGGKSGGPGGPGGKSGGPGGKSGPVKSPGAQGGLKTPAPATQPPPLQTNPPKTPQPQAKTQPPATQPRATQPPATQPPATQPPATQPAATQPPATNAPQTQAPPAQNRPAQQPNNVVQPCHCHAGQLCYVNHGPAGQNGQSVNQGGSQIGALGSSGLDITINLHLGGILFGSAGNQMSPAQSVANCPCAQQNAKPATTAAPTQPTIPPTVTQHPTTPKPTASPTKSPKMTIAQTNQPTPTTAQPTKQPTTAQPTKPPTSAQPTNPPTTAQPTNPPTTAQPTKSTNKLVPKFPSTAAPSTTPTTASTASTTTTTTSTTTTTPTTTVKPVQCYTCKDLSCYDMSLVNCPTDKPYCMSTISQSFSGARNFTKGCVTEHVCETQWWKSTAGLADCFLLDGSPSGFSGMPLDKCSFCCQGDGCNKDAIPPVGALYNPKTSAQPHPDSTATTVLSVKLKSSGVTSSTAVTGPPTSVSTSSSTSTSTSTSTPTPTTVAKRGLKCQVCGDLNAKIPCSPRDMFVPKEQLCPAGQFCMVDVLHDVNGAQTTYKRCVSQTACSRQWYHQTSDEGRCMQKQTGSIASIDCHYCCTTPGCNKLPRPQLSTLYKPK
ncbi:integumentary mucin C.1-like isoform X3 [Haliotis rufescens]|uniref:integumentary mucin C.1-like isoform X3 n=1 Tax=Haliotis rufescens TaxID=6454 RepID=UPI00201E8365|nr:integumentary mucin C.1-like isoform X3 [Haliotis rufescens]